MQTRDEFIKANINIDAARAMYKSKSDYLLALNNEFYKIESQRAARDKFNEKRRMALDNKLIIK